MANLKDDQLSRLRKNFFDLEDLLDRRLSIDNIADLAIVTALIAAGAVTQVKIAANALDATVVASVADSPPIAGFKLVVPVAVPAGATGNIDVVMTHKVRVVDVHLVKRNAAGGGVGTITVGNGANPITNAISINVADMTIVAAATLDDAFRDINAGGTLRVTRTRTTSTDETCDVYVHSFRVA